MGLMKVVLMVYRVVIAMVMGYSHLWVVLAIGGVRQNIDHSLAGHIVWTVAVVIWVGQ